MHSCLFVLLFFFFPKTRRLGFLMRCTQELDSSPSPVWLGFISAETTMCAVLFQPHPSLGTAAPQAPLSKALFRRECFRTSLFPSPGDLPNSGTEPGPLIPPALAGSFFTTSTTWGVQSCISLLL